MLTATDAEAGLAVARDDHPDLILMDIQLPGEGGRVTLEARRVSRADVAQPCGTWADGRRIPLAASQFDEFLRISVIAKPMRYQVFLETIAAQLARRSTEVRLTSVT